MSIVGMVNEDSEIEAVCRRINQRRQFAEKKVKDFEKQLKKVHQDLQDTNEGDWEVLKLWLKNKGRLPRDYNDQTHKISFNVKNNGILVNRFDEAPAGGSPSPGGGSFHMGELPPDLQKAMQKFIESQFKKD